MKFEFSEAAKTMNLEGLKYLTKGLSNPESGKLVFNELLEELGNSIDTYPSWHPILTLPKNERYAGSTCLNVMDIYRGVDHTVRFAKGFVTCPYNEDAANAIVERVNATFGLGAYRLSASLYADDSYPVVVVARFVELEADGTIRNRDALRWYVENLIGFAEDAQVAETWWNLRGDVLGQPCGSQSSLLVSPYTGRHMRKILDALNDSGLYGEIKESSLDMLSKKKRQAASKTLVAAAINARKDNQGEFEFELRGEICKAEVRDTWEDGEELSVRVTIGSNDFVVTGFYYPQKDMFEVCDPTGKRAIAEKFQ